MSGGLSRLLGDTPGRTIVKLLIISVVVGFVMNMMGWSPWDLVEFVTQSIRRLWRSGFAALGEVGNYLVVGAMIVIPVFIVLRILNWRKS
ncbi:DUF6460 domain-containing protein [Rhizobium sp.]